MRIPKSLLALGAVGLIVAGRKMLRNARRIDFADKVVLITGGSRGLGLALARAFAAEGAHLAICARTGSQLTRAEQELHGMGAQVIAQEIDVTDPEACKAFAAEVRRQWGRIDVLVNNAGVIQAGPYNAMERADYEQSLDTHFWGAFNMIQAALPDMRERKAGRIVNIASFGGKVSIPHMLPYSTGKFALVGYSEGLRAELQQTGVYVTTVCPGLMLTGSHDQVQVKGDKKEAEYVGFKTMDGVMGVEADFAADRILDGCRYGEAEVLFPFSSQALTVLHGIAPSFVTESLALVARLLPTADANGALDAVKGGEIGTPSPIGPIQRRLDKAKAENNEA